MTNDERREMREIVLCWMRDRARAVARAWTEALVQSHWFPELDPEFVEDIACLWLSMSIDMLAQQDDLPVDEFARKVRHSEVPEIDAHKAQRCFGLLEHIELGLIDNDFEDEDKERARRLVAQNVDSFRQRYFAVTAKLGTRH
jgi:hypothetical protein